ncbi:conserved oligomeric Golgi complex subunit 1 isoform X2 [Nilaparvata lugens]|uniref:conserved oligomeric Golgi complex subunit 1 isoform X1 n=1 Tax=Nilaparvata lugens TaxID=108931 RepID=UPI00193E5CB2|nr:conserved oligomeric Golgi complex subunit 1 isoform X1 [Nilaparvata lugens]XP_039287117.1 conserved oligomeric Golgi complex subunit 1 isoform X2 [Nilaparvata lugens]
MITSNLFEIDPDKLFETSSIEEIQKVQISIQHEIERKREELRTMVGERYRDLIEAADTIAEMKDISLNVIEDINKVSASTEEMHQKFILRQDVRRFKKLSFEGINTSKLDQTAVQMKVLISLPEQIWTFIDTEDYAKASQLYLLARHFKTGLEVQKFQCLLLDHQWEIIAQFKENILSATKDMLKQQTLSSESACNCFLAIMMLENLDSKGLVAKFLELRSAALHELLSVGDSFEDAAAIKKRFVASHSLIISTALVLCSCFIESDINNHDGLLYQNAREITGRDAKPIISLLPEIQSDFLSAVTVHRILPDLALDPVPPGEMAAAFEGWLSQVRVFVQQSGHDLLEKLNTLRSLQGLRKAYQGPSVEWNLALQRLMQPPNVDLWTTVYCPLIVERARALISLHWSMGLQHITTETIQLVNSADDSKCPETDLRWHVWKEEPQLDLTSDENDKNNVWWLKSQGVSPRVADMCRVLEDRLQLLTGDLAALCPGETEEVDATVLSDHSALRAHQQQVCLDFVSKLTEFVRDEINKSEKEAIPSLYARYLQIISKLCPSLQKCLTGLDFKTNSWQHVCSMLNENTEFAWTIWQQRVITKLKPVIQTALVPPTQLSDLLHMIPQWNVVEVEEIGESQQKIKSQLNVPSSASLQLLQVLAQINTTLSRAFIPLYATELVIKNVVQEIIQLYDQCEILCQAHALQHLFDLKYISALMVSPEYKSLQTVCRESIEKIERSIDPFDLDVFAPYIQDNVKKSLRETQLMFGVLCRPRMQTSAVQPTQQSSAANEDPSILALSQSGPSVWFRLLPVTAPAGTRAINAPKKAGKTGISTTPVGANPESDVSAKTTLTNAATSFFGSVTADWFGSS